jgi:hypothetical protein
MNLRTVAVLLMLVGAGCASRGSQAQSKVDGVVGDIQEVKTSVESAHKEMMATIKALEPVTTADSATLRPAFDKFSEHLESLDSHVASARGHAAGIAAQRDAYIKYSQEKSAAITNPEMKAQAEKRRAEFAESIMALNGKGQEVRKAFAPMQASLQDCRAVLEADMTPAAAASLKSELENLRKMNAALDGPVREFTAALDEASARLKPPVPPPAEPKK